MEISVFQLENLILTRAPFCFLDLRTGVRDRNREPELLATAQPVSEKSIEPHLRQLNLSLEHPLVLICQDGRHSQRVADQLEERGYRNVYVVARGVAGLLSELESLD